MRSVLAAVLLWQTIFAPRPLSEPASFRYRRAVTVPPAPRGSVACAVLDGTVYAHAMPSLEDVRLSRQTALDDSEIPYAVTISEPAETETEPAAVRHVAKRKGEIVFDLAMPTRPYTDVVLDLDARNYIASGEVSGSAGSGPPTPLGTFTLFDLSAEHLGSGTTLPLQESSFPVLHVVLRFLSPSGTARNLQDGTTVRGATVPPSREAQTVYTVVAETTNVMQEGQDTVARFALPAHVPVERISIDPGPGFPTNFSRSVVVAAHTADAINVERLSGQVERVRLERAGRDIRHEQLGFPATLGANLQSDVTVEVRVQNGREAPLPLRAVRLEMRERRLCFPADSSVKPSQYWLFYGDPAQETPRYGFAPTLSPATRLVKATLSAEALNPRYRAPSLQPQSLMKRHFHSYLNALLAIVCMLGLVAIYSMRRGA